MIGSPNPVWPLASSPKPWTKTGSFGAARPSSQAPTRHHQGIDLYAPVAAAVYACEDGVISGSQGWSGPKTAGLWVESKSTGIAILYGAVAPGSFAKKGTPVKAGQKIAAIGEYPHGSSMLHLELWTATKIPRPRWDWDKQAPPSSNLDPHEYLTRAMGGQVMPQNPQDIPVDPQDAQDDQGGDVPPVKPSGGGSGALVAVAGLGALLLLR